MVEIILLAMVALFVGLRLYSVLGRRTGHEQPLPKPVDLSAGAQPVSRAIDVAAETGAAADGAAVDSRAIDGVRAIVSADPNFDAVHFIEGAKGAYRMILEAYWKGDEETLRRYADEDVRETFIEAIRARAEAGEVLDNRLVSIERAAIERARMDGQMAVVAVRFDADIAAVTRDAEGHVIAGSTSDAVPTHDLWTFSRHVGADDPNWILIETDEAA